MPGSTTARIDTPFLTPIRATRDGFPLFVKSLPGAPCCQTSELAGSVATSATELRIWSVSQSGGNDVFPGFPGHLWPPPFASPKMICIASCPSMTPSQPGPPSLCTSNRRGAGDHVVRVAFSRAVRSVVYDVAAFTWLFSCDAAWRCRLSSMLTATVTATWTDNPVDRADGRQSAVTGPGRGADPSSAAADASDPLGSGRTLPASGRSPGRSRTRSG